MDKALLERVAKYSPPWVRYMLTLSEISRSGEGWVVADGDNLALWDTDGGSTLPIWPFEELAAEEAEGGAEATPVSSSEIVESLLPFLTEHEATLTLFPNFTSDVMVPPEAVGQDLTDVVAEPVDVTEQLAGAPRVVTFDDWAMLETPEMEEREPAEIAPPMQEPLIDAALPALERYEATVDRAGEIGWLWLLEAEGDYAGLIIDDEPALAVFPTREYAAAFAAKHAVPANPTAIQLGEFIDPLLFVAFAGGWEIGVAAVGDEAAIVSPARFSIDLGEAAPLAE